MTRLLAGDFVYRSAAPLVLEATEGCRLHTPDQTLIDCQATSGAAILGYDRTLLAGIDEVAGPIAKPQTGESHLRLAYAERLEALIANALGRRGHIGLELGGAQAIELAIKVALKRNPFLVLFTIEGAYHGRSLFTSHLSASRRYTLGTHLGLPVVRLPNPCLLAERSGLSISEATDLAIEELEAAFEDERLGIKDANGAMPVLVYEAIQNVAGMLDLPTRYLRTLERLIQDAQGITIVDEIFSGIYRFGPLFCHAEKGLEPDIVVFSKGLTNGVVPFAAIWVAEDSELAASFVPGTHSCTYLNYELGLVIADRVLDRLEGLNHTHVSGIADRLLNALQRRFDLSVFSGVFAKGTVTRLDFATEDQARAVSQALLASRPIGVLHATTGLAKRSIILHPPYVVPDTELEATADIFAAKLEAVA